MHKQENVLICVSVCVVSIKPTSYPDIDFVARICMHTYTYANKYDGGLKSLYDYISSAEDYFFDEWDENITTTKREVCGLQEVLCWKINFIWSHSMRIYCSAYTFFSWSTERLHTNIHVHTQAYTHTTWVNKHLMCICWFKH